MTMRYNADCADCRRLSPPVQIEQTRRGGEWRIIVEGRTVAHATRGPDARRIARLLVRGMGHHQAPPLTREDA